MRLQGPEAFLNGAIPAPGLVRVEFGFGAGRELDGADKRAKGVAKKRGGRERLEDGVGGVGKVHTHK